MQVETADHQVHFNRWRDIVTADDPRWYSTAGNMTAFGEVVEAKPAILILRLYSVEPNLLSSYADQHFGLVRI